MADNFLKVKPGITLGSLASDPTGGAEGDTYVNSVSGKVRAFINGAWRDHVTATDTQTLTNKTLDDTTTVIADTADATKQIKFNAAGNTGTSTTIVSSQTTNKTLTLPDATDTLVGKATSDVLSNKTLTDTTTQIVSAGDATKRLLLNSSSATAGTFTQVNAAQTADRTITLPDATDTLVGRATTDTLTNKSISGSTNTLSDIPNGATTATSANTNSAIVARDGSGNFSAGTITASLTGNVTGNVTGDVSGSATGTQANLTAHEADTSVHGVTGAVVGTTDTQTLSNKSVSDALTYAPIATPGVNPASGLKVYAKSDNKLYTLDSAGNEVSIGSGNGGINYITTGDGNSTTGWATYANTVAAATPEDGDGGTASITFTSTTTTPLRGAKSFELAKGAADRRGDGVSYAFTISDADKFKVLTVSFDYEVASGTYADGEVTVYLYDVTNSTVIQPTPYRILNTGVEAKHTCEFQTTSSTSYRLIFHVAGTSASAYTLRLDNVQLGPAPKTFGVAVTDWQSFTPTITNGGTTSTNTGFYRRVGDSLEVQVYTVFSGAGAAGDLSYTLPSGTAIDTAKVGAANRTVTGSGSWYDASATTQYEHSVTYATSTTLKLLNNGGSTVFQGNTLAASDQVSFTACLPLAGASSSTLMSSDADTRVVSLYATQQATQSVTANVTNVTFGTIHKDTHGGWSGSVYTVKVPGDYVVSATVADNAGSSPIVTLYKNGSAWANLGTAPGGNYGGGTALVPSLKAGETLSVRVSGTITLTSGLQNISINMLQGPAAIAASETIAMKATTSTQAISNGATNAIIYTATVHDSHGSYNAAAGTYTVSRAGKFRVSAGASPSGASTSATNTGYNLYVQKALAASPTSFSNEAHLETFTYQVTGVSLTPYLAGSTTVSLMAGDVLRINLGKDAGIGASSLAGGSVFNYFTVESVGI